MIKCITEALVNNDNLEALQSQIIDLIANIAGSQAESEAREIVEASCALKGNNITTISSQAIDMAKRRADGAPLGLVTGWQRFMGIKLLTGPDVLIPREETELLGREVVTILREKVEKSQKRELRLIDMGCGSGNIACAAAIAIQHLRVWASDLTESCAALTRANVAYHDLQGRVEVTQGDLFEPLRGSGLESTMDVIEMNPPYIASSSLEKQRADLLRHEPRAAFDGGPFGISIKTRLIREAHAFLKPDGHLLFEFGEGQAKQVRALVERSKLYSEIRFALDLNGEPRVAILKR
jgi:release factor glutamine methyltransferase